MLRSWRPAVRDAAAQFLSRTRLTAPARRARGRLSIATFHRVLPAHLRAEYPLPGLAVTPEELAWFLEYFKTHFTCGTLAESINRWQDRVAGPPPLAITFDDGQLDNYEFAKPVLEKAGIQASFYIPVAHIDENLPLWHDALGFRVYQAAAKDGEERRIASEIVDRDLSSPASPQQHAAAVVAAAKSLTPGARGQLVEKMVDATGAASVPDWARMMSWDQVRDMVKAGHEIGSHTLTHPLLPQLTIADLDKEIGESRTRLQDDLRTEISTFCYPNGDNDPRVVQAVKRAGYRAAVTTGWGTNLDRDELFTLKRCDMNSEHTMSREGHLSGPRLAWRMSGLHPGLT